MWLYLAIIFIIVYLIVTYYLEKFEIDDIKKKSVFITGCDSGFGHLLALKLVTNGATVFAGCLLESGEIELRKKAAKLPGKLVTIKLDVTKAESVRNALEIVTNETKETGLWSVVCNAGVSGSTGPDDWQSVEDYQKVIDVNTIGPIRVVHAFKPLLKRSKGRLVLMTSMAASITAPSGGPYSVSKYAAEAYADVLRRELSDFGVSVHIIKPGLYKTAITSEENCIEPLKQRWDKLDEQVKAEYGGEDYLAGMKVYMKKMMGRYTSGRVYQVPDAYYHAITAKRPRNRYFVGWTAQFIMRFFALVPDTFQDVMLKIFQWLCSVPRPKNIGRT